MDAEGQNCFLRRYKLIIFEEKEELNRTQRMWFRVKKRVLTARLLSVQTVQDNLAYVQRAREW